jgi:hypothetical protein
MLENTASTNASNVKTNEQRRSQKTGADVYFNPAEKKLTNKLPQNEAVVCVVGRAFFLYYRYALESETDP